MMITEQGGNGTYARTTERDDYPMLSAVREMGECAPCRKRTRCGNCGHEFGYPFSEALWDTDATTPHGCSIHTEAGR